MLPLEEFLSQKARLSFTRFLYNRGESDGEKDVIDSKWEISPLGSTERAFGHDGLFGISFSGLLIFTSFDDLVR